MKSIGTPGQDDDAKAAEVASWAAFTAWAACSTCYTPAEDVAKDAARAAEATTEAEHYKWQRAVLLELLAEAPVPTAAA